VGGEGDSHARRDPFAINLSENAAILEREGERATLATVPRKLFLFLEQASRKQYAPRRREETVKAGKRQEKAPSTLSLG